MPLISIIIPVYNSYTYLRQCLDSVLNQTFKEFELILIDDGSVDESGKICDEYSCKDVRVKTVHQSNHGQAASRNLGVELSTSEWVCFIDSDDIINKYYLEYLYKAVIDNKASMSVCRYIEDVLPQDSFFIKCDFSSKVYNMNEKIMMDLQNQYPNSYWTIWAKLIKRELVQSNTFTEGRIYEDNAVAPVWLFYANRIAVIDIPLYFYRINENGTTRSGFSQKNKDLLWALEEQLDFFDKISFNKMKRRILLYYINCVNSFLYETDRGLNNHTLRTRAKKTVKKYKDSKKKLSNGYTQIQSFLHPLLMRVINRIHSGDD